MSTFSAFRSVAVELLYPNLRCRSQRVLGLEFVRLPRLFHRHFHFSHPHRGWVKNDQPAKAPETAEEKKLRIKRLKEIGLKDKDIPYAQVLVRTSQGLSSYRPLVDVLKEVESLNGRDKGETSERKILKQYYVQLVAHEPGPIVVIYNSKEEYKKQKRTQERTRNNVIHQVRKEVQLTWASSEADVETKLEKMEEDLKKGFKVDLVIMPKKKVRPPGHEEMQQRADDLVTHFSEVAKEWRARDYTRTTVVIYFQGISSSAAAAGEEGRMPKRKLLKEQRRQKEEERAKKKQELEARSGDSFRDDYELSLS